MPRALTVVCQLLCCFITVAGCRSKELKIVTTPSGVQYADHEIGQGDSVKLEDLVELGYIGWVVREDSDLFSDWTNDPARQSWQFDNTLLSGTSITVEPKRLVPGWREGLLGMCANGKRTIIVPPHLGYGSRQVARIPPNSVLKLYVEVVAVRTPASLWQVDEKNAVATSSGLRYIIVENGSGPKARHGQKVSVHYSGYLDTGKKFDSSRDSGKPIEFILGNGEVIQGWDEGITLLNKGARARFIIPPELGYGSSRKGPIPPSSTLIFDLEIMDIR